MSAPYRRLGRIARAHGTQGEVSVATGEDLSLARLDGVAVWIVPPPGVGAVPRVVADVRPGPKGLLVRISGVDSAADAHDLTGRWLLVDGDVLPEPAAPEDDFMGMRVRDAERGLLGSVTDVIVTGANDVLVVDGGPFGQVLVPVIDDVIVSVNDAEGIIDVALLEGLIDEGES
jgi:16S rRNA processing protein RimM